MCITLFQQEVFSTFHYEDFVQAKSKLQQAGIHCRIKTFRSKQYHQYETIGVNFKYLLQYRIFVRRKDADAAVRCLR